VRRWVVVLVRWGVVELVIGSTWGLEK
jgi:hypothetical protein